MSFYVLFMRYVTGKIAVSLDKLMIAGDGSTAIVVRNPG